MILFSLFFDYAFQCFPVWFQAVAWIFLAITEIFLILRIFAFVFDLLPFV